MIVERRDLLRTTNCNNAASSTKSPKNPKKNEEQWCTEIILRRRRYFVRDLAGGEGWREEITFSSRQHATLGCARPPGAIAHGDPITQTRPSVIGGGGGGGKTTERIMAIATIVGTNLRVELIHPRDSPSPRFLPPAPATIYPPPPSYSRVFSRTPRLIIARP